MAKINKTSLWVRSEDLTAIKDILRMQGYAFWNESGVFSFHLLTAVITSIIWLAFVIIL